MTDLELLRRHEPILRFTAGELFFPCAVDEYVRACSLWQRSNGKRSKNVVKRGALQLDGLDEHGNGSGQELYLRYVERPLSPRQYQQWLLSPERPRFRASGRLARVPPWSRLMDSAFDLSLLIRGRVPGGTAAAAQVKYADQLTRDDRRVYYGRVTRAGGWTALNYLFFYVMNDWRSTFHGANDHEADWEQIFVFLYQDSDGSLQPRWVAYASHDYHGDDLRRRWDDPLLVKEGLHPVVFPAAGSHSSYYERGEYLMGVEPRFMMPVKRLVRSLRRFWTQTLGQGQIESVDRKVNALIDVPFVDYARGDGEVIGPGSDSQWTPILIDDNVPWVAEYRGLWGLDTNDPFGGERAPAGPKYLRDGSVRMSWYDPLGWAGLDKVVPPTELAQTLETRTSTLADELEQLDSRIDDKRSALQTLALSEEALRATERYSAIHKQTAADLALADADLQALTAQRNTLAQTRDAVERYAQRVSAGESDDPHAHLRHVHHPDRTPVPRRALQIWAALSGAIALLAVGLLVLIFPAYWLFWAIVFFLGFATVEAAAEGRLLNFLLSVAVVLAAISALILAREFWRALIVGALAIAIVVVIRDNLRELRAK